MAYLGHVISASGEAMDGDKVALRGFLCLAGYYRRFIDDFDTMAAPLAPLLHKEGFQWTNAATIVLTTLKEVLSTAPVLQLPDYTKPFIVDCDASGTRFGVVLH